MKLSIIIPVYVTREYDHRTGLKKLLNSLDAQRKGRDLELILVENGCTMDMTYFAHWAEERDWVIRKVYDKPLGIPKAHNVGLDIYTGDYVTFIDCDDSITDDYLDTLFPYMSQYYGYVSLAWRFEDGRPQISFTPGYRNNPAWGYLFARGIIGETRFNEDLKYEEDIDFVKRVIKPEIPHIDDCRVIYIYKWEANPNSYAHKWLRGEIK